MHCHHFRKFVIRHSCCPFFLKSATASGKMSGTVVGMMPIAILLMFFVVNKDFVMPLFTENLGRIFLGVAAGLEVTCFLIIKKITTIKM